MMGNVSIMVGFQYCVLHLLAGKINLGLHASKTFKKAFERKQLDSYTVEALDVGNIEKLR